MEEMYSRRKKQQVQRPCGRYDLWCGQRTGKGAKLVRARRGEAGITNQVMQGCSLGEESESSSKYDGNSLKSSEQRNGMT